MKKHTRSVKTITYAEVHRQLDRCRHSFVMQKDPKEIKKNVDITNHYIKLLTKKCGETNRVKHYKNMMNFWNNRFEVYYKARKV